ncbi:MAG: hypothetical protein QNL91_15330 [Candidatus Krumholzibacteria bacterium]|nr:hypothetical protein [Candidatus Krumholzibacteria bacterium]
MLGSLFGILAGLILFNLVTDPFNRNRLVDLGLPKDEVSTLINYQIFKILEFEHEPRPVIVLGDSRAEVLRASYFAEAGRPDVYNFAFGGGTLYEAIDTFWLAAESTTLKQVIVGVPFSMYTEANSMNRFPVARQVSRNFLSYYLSPLVTKASAANILTAVTGRTYVTEEPDMSREEFWEYQLGPGTALHWGRWAQPNILLARLEEVARYCAVQDIELIFWIPPTHQDLRDKLPDYGLEESYDRYKVELKRLGQVLDYDRPGELTATAENFSDPHHFNDEVAHQIVEDLVRELGD